MATLGKPYTFAAMAILIVDSGSTKCEWSVTGKRTQQSFFTQGMSPYFLAAAQLEAVVRQELLPQAGKLRPEAVFFYGTGTKDPANARVVKKVLEQVWPNIPVMVHNDLTGAFTGG